MTPPFKTPTAIFVSYKKPNDAQCASVSLLASPLVEEVKSDRELDHFTDFDGFTVEEDNLLSALFGGRGLCASSDVSSCEIITQVEKINTQPSATASLAEKLLTANQIQLRESGEIWRVATSNFKLNEQATKLLSLFMHYTPASRELKDRALAKHGDTIIFTLNVNDVEYSFTLRDCEESSYRECSNTYKVNGCFLALQLVANL